MKNITAFRWLVYLTVFPLMLIEELWRGARTAWDLWRAMTEQHEAKWKKPAAPTYTPEMAVASKDVVDRTATMLALRPTARKTTATQAAAVMQLSTLNLL